jgi:Ni/Fe-hydrogenase 1 B-type cytochrome subunit
MSEQIRRVLVWSGWLRLVHGALSLSTLVLLATGWLIAGSPRLAAEASFVHYLAASVLLAALVLRFFLGVAGKGAERFEHLLPRRSELAAIRASLLFYLSLGRAPLPNWFAHNPLWKPLYLVLYLLLAMSALSGWIMPEIQLVGRLYVPGVHAWLADPIAGLVIAHLLCVVLQDFRGRSADISAMLSGYRFFVFERGGADRSGVKQVSVSLDDLGRR